jgi:hypothetical protein
MMTNLDFSYHAMRMAKRATDWAADSIMPGMDRDKPVSRATADRYIKDQRDLLDYIEQETRS